MARPPTIEVSQGDAIAAVAGGTVVLDSLFINRNILANDSMKIYFRKITNKDVIKIDSLVFDVGASGWGATPTLIPNGDYTIEDDYGYMLYINGFNNNSHIYFEHWVKIIYHLE